MQHSLHANQCQKTLLLLLVWDNKLFVVVFVSRLYTEERGHLECCAQSDIYAGSLHEDDESRPEWSS
jgi:hypothetical protein